MHRLVTSSLQADSEGLLKCQLPGQENWKLFGIASWGIQCAAVESPGVYT